MTFIKYDFNSCYNAYDFSQFDNEQINQESDSNRQNELADDILQSLLSRCGIEIPQPSFVRFPDPIKLLTTCRNKVRKTLPVTPKSIIFNKTNMAKHPDIELNNATIFK